MITPSPTDTTILIQEPRVIKRARRLAGGKRTRGAADVGRAGRVLQQQLRQLVGSRAWAWTLTPFAPLRRRVVDSIRRSTIGIFIREAESGWL